MEFIKVDASIRKTRGKGASRRLRNAGFAPAVIYGKGAEGISVSLVPSDLQKALAGPLRINTPLSIAVLDKETKKSEDKLVIVKDHQYDPITRELLHVDFLSITEDQEIEVKVPVIREGRSMGEQLGGVLRMVRRVAPVICKPSNIPESITIDVSKLGNNVTLHVSELELPEGVSVNLPPNKAMLTISAIIVEEEETTEETEAAAAPAADAAEESSDK